MQTQTALVASAAAVAVCYVLYRRSSREETPEETEDAKIRRVLSLSRHMNAGA